MEKKISNVCESMGKKNSLTKHHKKMVKAKRRLRKKKIIIYVSEKK